MRSGMIKAALLTTLAAGLASCGPRAAAPPSAGGSDTAPTAQYLIGPGDHLGIFVYQQPTLGDADLPVRPDGRISTPLVPDIQVAGKTPSMVAHELEGRLATFIRDPKVTVMVRSFIGPFSQQIRVVGEATDPVALPYSAHMTVLDVMIMTKGLTRFAAGNRAVIVRRQDTPGAPPVRIPVHLSSLLKDGDISQNVEMRPGDTLIIPQGWF